MDNRACSAVGNDATACGARLYSIPHTARALAEGKSNKEIAGGPGITIRTVETHRAKIMLKLGLHSLAELIHYAIRSKIVPPPSATE